MSVFSNFDVRNWVLLTMGRWVIITGHKWKVYSSYLRVTLFPLNNFPFAQGTPFWIGSYLGLVVQIPL